MKKLDLCQQNRAFLNEEAGFFRVIKHYDDMDIVKAQVIAADHSEEYFIITHTGELLIPQRMGSNLALKEDKHYPELIKKYPKAELFGEILGFPKMKKLAKHQTRLIFKQYILNGCWACDKAGIASVAYDFDSHGVFEAATRGN